MTTAPNLDRISQDDPDASSRASAWRRLLAAARGKPRDWIPAKPRLPRPSLAWVGTLLVVVTTALAWPAHSAAGGAAAGLAVGMASIVLMAWSFILAIRIRVLEPIFGGLDSMYRVHRWAGAAAVGLMFLHTNPLEPEGIANGIRGASPGMANAAEELAGVGEVFLYVLVGISLLRLIPYRFWRWTHKLLGIPFAFAAWHAFTSTKPYANDSTWGWYFTGFMVAGLAAFVWRVLGRDAVVRGVPHRVVDVEKRDRTTIVELAPTGRRLRYRAGQFAVLKLDVPGLREPHAFTIACGPERDTVRFAIRDLGDWTSRIREADLMGATARIEGPYGHFRPLARRRGAQTVWVAGGVGITPFLAAADTLEPEADPALRPLLVYCVGAEEDATGMAELRAADADGRIRIEMFASRDGRRFTPEAFAEATGSDLRGAHVAACGPVTLLHAVEAAASKLGATHVHTEDFDMRSGIGPDVSREIDEVYRAYRSDSADKVSSTAADAGSIG